MFFFYLYVMSCGLPSLLMGAVILSKFGKPQLCLGQTWLTVGLETPYLSNRARQIPWNSKTKHMKNKEVFGVREETQVLFSFGVSNSSTCHHVSLSACEWRGLCPAAFTKPLKNSKSRYKPKHSSLYPCLPGDFSGQNGTLNNCFVTSSLYC